MRKSEQSFRLSPREQQIAELLLQGCSNTEIAQELRMKRRTVKAYMNRFFQRFDIKDGIKRVKLATFLYRRMSSQRASQGGGVLTIDRHAGVEASLETSSIPAWQSGTRELISDDSDAELHAHRASA